MGEAAIGEQGESWQANWEKSVASLCELGNKGGEGGVGTQPWRPQTKG